MKPKHKYHYDIERLIAVAEKYGEELTYDDAITIWERYSDSCAAGWMMVSDDDKDEDIMYILRLYSR